MNRTRRRAVKARRGPMVPIPFTVFIALVVTGALFYLRLCGKCDRLGRMLQETEQEQVVLQRRFQHESLKWANLRAPENISVALDRHGLTMGWPTREQIVRLYDVNVEHTYSMVGLRSNMR